jgi:hypothetical protein
MAESPPLYPNQRCSYVSRNPSVNRCIVANQFRTSCCVCRIVTNRGSELPKNGRASCDLQNVLQALRCRPIHSSRGYRRGSADAQLLISPGVPLFAQYFQGNDSAVCKSHARQKPQRRGSFANHGRHRAITRDIPIRPNWRRLIADLYCWPRHYLCHQRRTIDHHF